MNVEFTVGGERREHVAEAFFDVDEIDGTYYVYIDGSQFWSGDEPPTNIRVRR